MTRLNPGIAPDKEIKIIEKLGPVRLRKFAALILSLPGIDKREGSLAGFLNQMYIGKRFYLVCA